MGADENKDQPGDPGEDHPYTRGDQRADSTSHQGALPVDLYRRHSLEELLTAAESGDKTAIDALKEFIRLRAADRKVDVAVERHPRHGWRVRRIQDQP